MAAIIKTEDLRFSYPAAEGVTPIVLDGVSVAIEKGSFVAVLGHNGSGKSTLAKHMNAILLPSGVAVYVDGIGCDMCRTKIKEALQQLDHVTNVVFQREEGATEYIELFLDREIPDMLIEEAVGNAGEYQVGKIE